MIEIEKAAPKFNRDEALNKIKGTINTFYNISFRLIYPNCNLKYWT